MRFAYPIIGWIASVGAALCLLYFWAFAPVFYTYDGAVDPKWTEEEFTRHLFRVRLVPTSHFKGHDAMFIWGVSEAAARSAVLLATAVTCSWIFAIRRCRSHHDPKA
jgi:hypothetical protein